MYTDFSSQLLDCDKIFIDSKFYKFFWNNNFTTIIKHFEFFKKEIKKICYFDTTDSTGNIQNEVFDYIDVYFKSQILKKRELYKRKYYGSRIFTDYMRSRMSVADKNEIFHKPLKRNQIKKIKVFWNSSLSNYSLSGRLLNFFFRKTQMNLFLRYPKIKYRPNLNRPIKYMYKGNFSYDRETISWQRRKIFDKVKNLTNTKRENFIKYIKILKKTKIMISPFGWGEINYKDYESFLYGNLLLKPNIDHLETWPNLFKKNVTYIPFSWDLSNFDKVLKDIEINFEDYIGIAKKGQENYFGYLSNHKLIFNRLINICRH